MIRFTATLTILACSPRRPRRLRRWSSRAADLAPSGRRRRRISRAALVSRCCSRRSTRHTPVAGPSRSSPVPARRGTRIPAGQILIVTAGTGRVQRWGDPIEEIRAGDVVRIPAGEKHWHGASPQASMTHIAITEHRDGTAVQWMEKVSDEQYNGASDGRTDSSATSGQSDQQPQPQPQGTADRRDRCSNGSRPAWRRSPTTCCSAMCGGGPSCRHATAAW